MTWGRKKKTAITDQMIGMDDKLCSCSSLVGEMLRDGNKEGKKRPSLKEIVDSMKTEKNRKL